MRSESFVAAEKPTLAKPLWLAGLTVEHGAYALIVVLAFVLRFVALGQQPFSPAEAEQAWSALAMLRGEAALPAPGVSPLLLSLHWLTFAITEPAETLARVWPALAGTLLVLVPYALRREVGRLAALLATLLLALSASLTFWSRSATGESLTLLATLALLGCMVGLRREGGERWAGWTSTALALLLLSSPAAYTALILLAPLALIWWRDGGAGVGRRDGQPSLWTGPGAVFVAMLVLGSTALLLDPAGLAALADLPGVWLSQFTQAGDYAWGWLWFQFLAGEPLLVAAGLAGLVLGLWPGDRAGKAREAFPQQRRLAIGLGLWLLLGLVLSGRPGRTAVEPALLALPLALLGGQALAAFAAWLDPAEWKADALALLVGGVAILVSAAIWLAEYAGPSSVGLQPVFLVSAAGTLLLLLVVLASYALLFSGRITAQIGVALLILALLAPSLRATFTLNHNDDGLRWGSLLTTTGAADGRNIPTFLARLAWQQEGDLRDLPVTLILPPGSEPSPLLRWYLREAEVTEVAGGWAGPAGGVLVSLADDQPSLPEEFSGRSYRLTQTWPPQGLSGLALWRWLLYGRFDGLEAEERAVIWVQTSNE